MPIVTCGLDTAKHIFHFHGLTCDGEVKRKTLKRKELLTFFAKLDVFRDWSDHGDGSGGLYW